MDKMSKSFDFGWEDEEEEEEKEMEKVRYCSQCGKKIAEEDYDDYYGKDYHKKCLEEYKAQKEREKQRKKEKAETIIKTKPSPDVEKKIKEITTDIDKLKTLKEKIKKQESEAEQLKDRLSRLEEENETLREDQELKKDVNELLLILYKVIKSLDVSNKELKEIYKTKFKEWRSQSKIFKLEFGKVIKLLEEKVEIGGLKGSDLKNLKSGKDFDIISDDAKNVKYLFNGVEIYDPYQQSVLRRHFGLTESSSTDPDSNKRILKKSTGGKTNYLRGYIELINLFPELCVSEDNLNLDELESKTINTIKIYLEQRLKEIESNL